MRCSICGKRYEDRVNPTEDICPKCICGTEEGMKRSHDYAVARLLARRR